MGILDVALAPFRGIENIYDTVSGAKGARQAAQKQMEFQERLSGTAYQRAADDLEAAGLNRILALGSPASTPGGAAAPVPNMLNDAASAASVISGIKTQGTQRKLMTQQADQAAASAKQAHSQARLNNVNAGIRDEIHNIVKTPSGFKQMLDAGKEKIQSTFNSALEADEMMQDYVDKIDNKINALFDDFMDTFNKIPEIDRSRGDN